MPQQQGKTGQICLWVSGAILCICGVACCAAAYSAMPLFSNSFSTACDSMANVAGCLPCEQLCNDAFAEATKGQPEGASETAEAKDSRAKCLSDCKASGDQFNKGKCIVDLKREAGGCQCTEDDKPESCNCAGTALDGVQQAWELACTALGALGLVVAVVFTGLPALVAGTTYTRVINACCYSVCAGIFSCLFIGMGAGFILIGAFVAGPGGEQLMQECQGSMGDAMKGDSESTGSESMDAAMDDAVNCATDAFCKGVTKIVSDVGSASMQIGIPFFLAGITMFFGCYVCCCCKTSVPQPHDKVEAGIPMVKGDEQPAVAVATAVAGIFPPLPPVGWKTCCTLLSLCCMTCVCRPALKFLVLSSAMPVPEQDAGSGPPADKT